jgi:DNA-binding IclR family transcriptional regulator
MLNQSKFIGNKNLEYSSVQKSIGILLSFIPDNKPMGTLQLSKSLGLNKSTVSRLLHVLIDYGLIQQDEETKKYSLGRTTALLGKAVGISQIDGLAQFARPLIDALSAAIGESACLEMLVSGHTKLIYSVIGPPPVSVSFQDSLPVHAAAGAKAILAYSSSEEVKSMINGELKKITENTITDIEEFNNHLGEINKQGIAYDHGEASTDVHAVSAPILNHLNKPVAAVSICVPATRVSKIMNSKTVDELKKTAKLISEHLFFAE